MLLKLKYNVVTYTSSVQWLHKEIPHIAKFTSSSPLEQKFSSNREINFFRDKDFGLVDMSEK